MAKYSHPSSFDFFQQSPALDSKPIFSPDDEMSVLDDKILDSNTQDITSLNGQRRSSFDHTTDDFSRRDSVWSDMAQHHSGAQSRQPSQMSTPLFEPIANPFVHTTTYPPQQWTLATDSGSCTPTPMYEQFPHDFDAAAQNPFAGGAVGAVQPVAYPTMPYRPGSTFAPHNAIPMSPQSSQGWASASADPAEMQTKAARKNSTTATGYRNSSNLHIRRDGIRKKNARFDIPAERTLSNIDLLISRSTDEEEIKELKQQKRLLRNRQAAGDILLSMIHGNLLTEPFWLTLPLLGLTPVNVRRCTTEQLEEDKRRSTTLINELQEAIREMKLRETELVREKNELLEGGVDSISYSGDR
uniref:Uncharacterized protein n=1 Tax=Coccidioides posadasii RMSCC 3488 TaxID=454284 RepID=A0A0J6IAF8_COCPO|nr:hypothetical protein CPAG_04923 [Coccidioides posadasii RMSCC 3488]